MSTDYIRDFYSKSQTGAWFSVYSGTRRQIGGSFLSGLARIALPILKFLGDKVLNIGKNVATDVIIDKKPFKQAMKSRTFEEVGNTLKGRGVKRRSMMHINKAKVRKKKDIFG